MQSFGRMLRCRRLWNTHIYSATLIQANIRKHQAMKTLKRSSAKLVGLQSQVRAFLAMRLFNRQIISILLLQEDDMLSAIFAQPDEGCSITEYHAQETCPGKVCGCYESCCKDSKFRAHDEGHSKARKEHILCYFDANYCSTTAGCTVIPVIPETDALFDSYSSPSVVACLRGNHTRSE